MSNFSADQYSSAFTTQKSDTEPIWCFINTFSQVQTEGFKLNNAFKSLISCYEQNPHSEKTVQETKDVQDHSGYR